MPLLCQSVLPGGGPLIGHIPFLNPGVDSTPTKPRGSRAMEVWFCPKEKQSALYRALCKLRRHDGEPDRYCPSLQGADISVGETPKSKLTNVKITTVYKSYEKHRQRPSEYFE